MGGIITTHALARTYQTKTGSVHAVNGLDLEVQHGELIGLLGPNGAGKTTTLRMLATLLLPTTGTAIIAGYDLVRQSREVRRRIGYVAQVGGAPPSPGLRLGEELITQGRLQGLSKADAQRRLAELAGQLSLHGLEHRALLELSGGQRRRFDVALGLMHSPGLLYLDEPTTGLDPHSRAQLWQHIRELRDEHGVTVLLSTHYLDEADLLADRVLIMDDGRIVADSTPAALKAQVSGDVITIGVLDPGAAQAAEPAARAAVPLRDYVATDSAVIVMVADGAVAVAPLLHALEAAGAKPTTITVNRPTLDDVFLTLTGRPLSEEQGPP